MKWYIGALKDYIRFSGRARRMEYWMFTLINCLIAFAIGVVASLAGAQTPAILNVIDLYWLATFLPTLSVGVRRMHDTDHSGWWLLVPIVNLVFAVTAGQRADNRFGPDPKAGAAGAT